MTPGQEKIRSWRANPVQFVREVFGAEPDAWQADALMLFADPNESRKRIALSACAGPGKSTLLAWCGWNFLTCYADRGQHPKGAAVSVTWDNLKDNLWAELAKWQGRSQFLLTEFDWTAQRISSRQFEKTWFLSARSWPKTANADEQGRTLSGLHSDYVLALVDESGEIPVSVLRAAEQALGGCKWGRIVQAGNPISHEGMLYAAATQLRHLWQVVTITADPDDPKRTPRVDIEYAREQIRTWGRDNPWVMAYILGQFPPTSINSLLSIEDVQQSIARKISIGSGNETAQKRIGVDVARFGSDSTVIFPRQGLIAFPAVEMRNARTNEIAARLAKAKIDWSSELEFIDDTGGYGGGVVDSMIQAQFDPIPVNAAGKADDPRMLNKRAECWWRMAEWVKRGGALPNIPALIGELTVPTYTYVNGKFQLEPKDKIKERLGRSPNFADALSLTFSLVEMPGRMALPFQQPVRHVRALTEYDPYSEEAFQR